MEDINETTQRKRRTGKSSLERKYNEIYDSLKNRTEPVGTLYNSINYTTLEDLDIFIDNLNENQALFCLIEASKMAHNRNIFTIEEAELLSKSIRILKQFNDELK